MESLHRVVCEWGGGFRLEIECSAGASGRAAEIRGHPLVSSAEVECAPDALTTAGIPAMAWRDDDSVLFEPLQLREETDYLIDVTVPYPRAVAASLRETQAGWPFSERLDQVLRSDPPKRWRDVPGGVVVTGILNFGSAVGVANLAPRDLSPLRVEVVPRKLGYFGDFRSLLEDIAGELTGLLIEIDTAAGASFAGSDQGSHEPSVRLFHFRGLMESRNVPAAMDALLLRPHTKLATRVRDEEVDAIADVDAHMVAENLAFEKLSRGGPLQRLFLGHSPQTVPYRSSSDTFDTRENRYIKGLLLEMLDDVSRLEIDLRLAGKVRSAREAAKWATQLENWLAHPLWREVHASRVMPSNSQVLQRRAGYREMLAADMRLQLGMRLPWPRGLELFGGAHGDLRPVEELYEYWCFFAIRSILREICGPGAQKGSLVQRGVGGFEIRLARGGKARTDFLFDGGENSLRVSLYYNRSFHRRESRRRVWTGSYSSTFRPDYSILVRYRKASLKGVLHWLHFDAKYRIDRLEAVPQEGHPLTQALEVYQRRTLDAMHSYRDGVLGTRGAYVLYPGSGVDEDVFIRFPGAEYPRDEPPFPGVGAFALRPGDAGEQRVRATAFLRSILESMAMRPDYGEEIGIRTQ